MSLLDGMDISLLPDQPEGGKSGSGFQDTPQNEAAPASLLDGMDISLLPDQATPAPAAVKDYILPASKVAGIDVERIRADFEEAKRSNVMLPVAQEHGYALKEGRLINERILFAQRTAANIDQWLPRTKEEYLRSGAGMVAASFDDMDNMGMFERVYAETALAYDIGKAQEQINAIEMRRFLGESKDKEARDLQFLQDRAQSYAKQRLEEGIPTKIWRGFVGTIGAQGTSVAQRAITRGLQAGAGLGLATAATGIGAAAAPVASGAAFLAGAGTGTAEYLIEQTVGNIYGAVSELRDVDGNPVVSENTARVISALAAVPTMALESVGLGLVFKNLPGFDKLLGKGITGSVVAAIQKSPALLQGIREGVRRFLTVGGAETAIEVAQEGIQIGAEKLAENMSSRVVPRGQLPAERLKDAAIEAAAAFFIPAAFGGIGGGVGTWRAARRKAAQAQGERDALTTLATAAQNSKMLAGAPTATEAALSNIMAGQDIYMDAAAAAALFQTDEGVDMARRIGLTEASVAEAIDLGHDVVIPAAKAAAHLMRSPLWQEMEPHTRLNATAATAEEAQRYADGDRTSAALAAQDFLSFLDDVDNDIARKGRWKEWTAEYRSSLEQAGYTPLQAESFGDVLGAHAEVMAPLFGQPPDTYLKSRLDRIISTTPGRFGEEKALFGAGFPARDKGALFQAANLDPKDARIRWRSGTHAVTAPKVVIPDTPVNKKSAVEALNQSRNTRFALQELGDIPLDDKGTHTDEVRVARDGVGESVKNSRSDDAYKAYAYTPQIIENTKIFRDEPGASGKGRVAQGLANVEIGGKPYAAHVTFKLALDKGKPYWKYYGHRLFERKKGASGTQGLAVETVDPSTDMRLSDENLYTLLEEVKAALPQREGNKQNTRLPEDISMLFQPKEKSGSKEKPIDKARGLITSRQLDGARMIALFKGKADISTIIHEGAGHFFLENLREAASLPNAPDWVKQDWQTVADYIGAGKAEDKIAVDAHEKFARAAVEFFRTGKAPSGLLHSAFSRFSRWLTSIFKVARRYLVDREDITPEVADVFQRLMATEEDIAQAKAGLGLPQEKPAKVDPAKWDTYQKLAAKAEDEAEKSIFLRRMDEEKRVEREARLEAQVLAAADPEQNAVRAYIEMGGVDYASLMEQFGEDAAVALRDKWRGGAGKKLIKAGGDMTVEDLCTERGWSDIGQALAWLTETPTPREFADAVVEQRRAEWEAQYNPKAEAVASAAADAALRAYDEAVSGTVQVDTESMLRAMRKRIADKSMESVDGEYEAMMAAWGRRTSARKLAEKLAAQEGKTLKDFEQTLARKAELAGAAVAEAEARGDKAVLQEKWRAAKNINALRQRSQETILQERQRRAALGEAYRARMERDRLITQVRRTARSKSMAPAYKEQVQALVSRFTGLGTPTMRPNRPDVPGLTAFLTEHAANSGLEVAEGVPMLPPVAPWLLESMEYGEPRRFNELTLDQQRDVYRAVKILQHMASSEKKLLGEMRQREIDATVAELTESIDRLPERRFITDREKKYRFSLGNLLHVWRENHGTKLMQSYIFKAADGYISKGSEQAKGPNERLLQEPFSKAESQELLLQSKFTKLLEKALHPLAKDKDLLKPFAIPEVALPNDVTLAWGKGRSWDMEKVFCVALNMGNEGNLNALRKGYGWTDADLAAITGRLTPEQWQAVQAVWDTIDKLYPRLNDVYETLNGVPLPKVERVPLNVTAADGSTVTLGGGYYPLVFDRRFKDKAGMLEDVDDALNFTEAMLRTPKPKSGMTKTRTGGTLPPKLSADVVMRHVTDTIHYVTHELPLRNVYQIVRDQKYAESFTRAFGKESYETLLPWLRGIARPEKIHKSAGDNTVEFLCKMGTLNVMGFSFTTAMMGFTSLTNSMHRVGTLPFLRAVGDFAKHPVENWRTVTALSPYMANRATMMDRDIGSALKEWRGTDNMLYIGPLRLSRQRFGQAAYALISAVDSVVAMPTWMGAYKKAVAAGKAMEEAVQAGDDAVLEAQAGGGRSSMSALMRDPGMWRLLTVFMTFSNNMYNRQAYYLSGLIARAKGGKAASAITLKDATMAFAMELFIPALSAVLLMGLLREGEAPEEKDYLMEILSGMTQGYIWMRAAVSYLKSGFEPGSPVAFSWIKPAAQVISTLAEAVKENRSLTKKESAQTLRRIIKVGGFFTGVPTVQAFRTVDGIEAFNKGKGGPLTPLLGKPTEKKK